ncbi:haloacid dehalogenase [Spirochaetia bacterium]|nr:haloacid dehalogenase [Spirochaetia bacterium]
MKLYNIPEQISGFLFDMDSTLYTHPEYAQFQIDALILRLAAEKGTDLDQIRREMAEYRQMWTETHGGEILSYVNTFAALGVPVETSVQWRSELYDPADFLHADPHLRNVLFSLGSDLALVTNNPVAVAEKTLNVLGIRNLFQVIVGLDTCLLSKPNPAPFLYALQSLNLNPDQCIAVGDRYDIDLSFPISAGCGGILVDGVEDVYQIPALLTR